MKNRPREIRRLLELAALTIAKGLYPESKYKVSKYGRDVYVDQCSGQEDACKLIISIDIH
jgi:hypothetical protein